MVLALIVENRMGISWMGKRLSKDSAFRDHLWVRSGGALRMSGYSAKQFDQPVHENTDYLSGAGATDVCFAENTEYLEYWENIEQIWLYRWNRDYPADVFFAFPPGEWSLVDTEEFRGTSHEKITLEVYVHERKNNE